MRILEAATVRIGSNNMLHILLALDASDVGLDDPRNQCIVMDFYFLCGSDTQHFQHLRKAYFSYMTSVLWFYDEVRAS